MKPASESDSRGVIIPRLLRATFILMRRAIYQPISGTILSLSLPPSLSLLIKNLYLHYMEDTNAPWRLKVKLKIKYDAPPCTEGTRTYISSAHRRFDRLEFVTFSPSDRSFESPTAAGNSIPWRSDRRRPSYNVSTRGEGSSARRVMFCASFTIAIF